jgi:hypothetical protein
MTDTISRMYGSQNNATGAVAELKLMGFRGEDIHVVSPPAEDANSSIEAISASIMEGYVLRTLSRIYAEGVRRGGTLVTVHAPFGSAATVIGILDKFQPIDSGVAEPAERIPAWDEAAPISSMLQMPTLYDNPTPFGSFWNVPSLTNGRASLSALFGLPELSSSQSGTELLNDPAPLSSLLRIPVLRT